MDDASRDDIIGYDELAQLCHDVRQYLSAALLISSMPGDDLLDNPVRERLQLLHRVLVQAMGVVGGVTGDPATSTRLDLAEIVEDSARVARAAGRVPVEVHRSDHAYVEADPHLLRRAILNVLENATRAATSQGAVTVTVGHDGGEAWVEVVDDGAGFGHIRHGSGRGLEVVSTAVRASGGRFQISSGPGPGTTVRVSLPRQREDGAET